MSKKLLTVLTYTAGIALLLAGCAVWSTHIQNKPEYNGSVTVFHLTYITKGHSMAPLGASLEQATKINPYGTKITWQLQDGTLYSVVPRIFQTGTTRMMDVQFTRGVQKINIQQPLGVLEYLLPKNTEIANLWVDPDSYEVKAQYRAGVNAFTSPDFVLLFSLISYLLLRYVAKHDTRHRREAH